MSHSIIDGVTKIVDITKCNTIHSGCHLWPQDCDGVKVLSFNKALVWISFLNSEKRSFQVINLSQSYVLKSLLVK